MMSGAGGNCFMTIYDPVSKRVYSLNATGAAPLRIDPNNITAAEISPFSQSWRTLDSRTVR